MLDLILLGSGGNMPMPGRFLSSLFINYKGEKMLIDCGEGTQVAMRTNKCGFKDVSLILITHLHGDHMLGLPGLLSTIGNSSRVDDLTIVGPVGIKDTILSIRTFVEYLPYNIKVIENPKETFSLDNAFSDLEISTIELEHSTECLGYTLNFKRKSKFNVEKALENEVPKVIWKKLQEKDLVYFDGKQYSSDMVLGETRKGIKISYITDTRPIFSIPDFIKDSTLFICEGMYGDDLDISKAVKNGHMTFREAANLARLGNVQKLLLTHFSPSVGNPSDFIDNATSVFPNTTVGEDGLRMNLNFE